MNQNLEEVAVAFILFYVSWSNDTVSLPFNLYNYSGFFDLIANGKIIILIAVRLPVVNLAFDV